MSAQPPLADNRHYTATAKWLHWSMAALWLAAWILGVLAVSGAMRSTRTTD